MCIYIYKNGLKSSYDDDISAVDDFLTTGIQILQHRWKYKGDYIEKWTLLGHIPWEYLEQTMNFSVNPHL